MKGAMPRYERPNYVPKECRCMKCQEPLSLVLEAVRTYKATGERTYSDSDTTVECQNCNHPVEPKQAHVAGKVILNLVRDIGHEQGLEEFGEQTF